VIPLTLAEVSELCPGRLDTEPWAEDVTGVQIDSRRVRQGDLFVAVGRGAEFREQAFAAGAAAVLVPEDAFQALAALGRAVRGRSSARVVGITGSTGKTSTKDILHALCRPHARTIAAEASFNAELGLPLTLCRLEEETEICILELAMRAFGQIADLASFARPEIGVITAIGPVHLEFVGSVEGVARAKAELLEALPPGGTAIVPAGIPELEQFLDREDLEVVRFGPGGEIRAEAFEPQDGWARLEADVCGRRLVLEPNFQARHHVSNALAALGAYRALGLPLEQAGLGAGEIAFSRLRGEELALPGGGMLINDCWNANPVSLEAALEHLLGRAQGRRTVAVLGQMAELGSESDAYHLAAGRRLAELGVDVLIAIGPLARGYVEGAGESVTSRWTETVSDGIAELESVLSGGDCMLVKGSRAMGLEAVAEALSLARSQTYS
jgi:UDP-N-acetylmuramoyl-tripeptide--D-alanyl-D-alanine ligase